MSEATPETEKKLRRDEVIFLFQKGYIEREHVEAAREIEEIWHAACRSVFRVGMVYEPRDYDIPKKYSGRFPMEAMTDSERRIYRLHYIPWAAEMAAALPAKRHLTQLQLVMDVVADNRHMAAIERLYGIPKGKGLVSKYLRAALGRYAEIAGIDVGGRSGFIPKKPQHVVDAGARSGV